MKNKTLRIIQFAAMIIFFPALPAAADTISKPHTIEPETTAKAFQVNTNFDVLYDQQNKIGSAINVVQATRDVGIGTTTPTHRLEVNSSGDGFRVGNTYSWFKLWTGGNSRLSMGDGSDGEEAGFVSGGENDFGQNIVNLAACDDAGNCPKYLTLHQSGNVGIGTRSPQGTLDVDGAIYQRGSELHADYVFEHDFELEFIREHTRFMWENKHLKGIPKGKMDEAGREIVEVGAHRKGIVEELEKAQIYIAQLHDRLKEQESRLAKLEALLNERK